MRMLVRPAADAVRGRKLCGTAVLACVVAVGSVLFASPVWAHGDGETEVGYELVQQALGYIVDDPTTDGLDLAMEKVDDALNTKDQDGVDVAELEKAMTALQAGQAEQGRTLLQDSISEAVSQLEPATGEETGTTVILDPMRGRDGLAGQDWGFLVISVLLLILGVAAAWLFGPQDNVRELRRRLNPPVHVKADTQPDPPSGIGS